MSKNIKLYVPLVHDNIKHIQKEIEPLRKKLSKEIDRIIEYEKSGDKYIVENKLYFPLEIMEQHKDEAVYCVTFYKSDGTIDRQGGEICEIDKDGHFNMSDDHGGIIEWSWRKNKYLHFLYGSVEELDYVGIKEILFPEKDGEDNA